MQYDTEAANIVAAETAYGIANDAESGCSNAEAALFYEHIRDALAEAIDYALGDRPTDDALDEIADGAPDVYNYTRMMEAIGTGAYLDKSDLANGDEDMVTLAGYVLYDLARTVINNLLDNAELGE
jgi:hypothetical protein